MTQRSDALPLFAEAAPPPTAPIELKLNELLALPDEQYNADDTAVRKTWLDQIERSPAHLQAYRAGLIEATPEMIFGQFLHAFVLEPDLVHGRFYREPELGNRNSKAVQAKLADLAAAHVGKIAIREAQYDSALAMRDALYAHRAARKLLEYDGHFERSIFWDNTETGERCKAKYDKVAPAGNFICDIKTTRDASPAAFGKSIWEYRLDVQARHYCEPTGLRFVLVAIEKQVPWGVSCYAIPDDILRIGEKRRLPNLRTYAECRAKNVWPCYKDFIQIAQLPRWAA